MSSNKYKGTSPSGELIEGDALNYNYYKLAESWRQSRERTWRSSHHSWALPLNRRLLQEEMVTGPERPYTKDPGNGSLPPA